MITMTSEAAGGDPRAVINEWRYIIDKFWEIYLTFAKAFGIAVVWTLQLLLFAPYTLLWAAIEGLTWVREKVEEWKPVKPGIFEIEE